jgi:putative SOS response-associated peptidase YedK
VGPRAVFHEGPQEARKPINARSETIAMSGMFKEAFAGRRCLVPAPVYYEWRDDPDGKTPFAVARVDGDPVAFGGIWEAWRSPERERLQTFATITTDANDLLAPIQDRMPVIIEKADWPVWLGEAEGDPAAMLRPAPYGVLRVWKVDRKLGNVRNDGPDLIKPISLNWSRPCFRATDRSDSRFGSGELPFAAYRRWRA